MSLIERLALDDSRPIVSVVAPAGYGKTTLLSHWAENSSQAFAWVSVDEDDNDPKVLLGYVARALDAVQPIGSQVFEALASPVSSVPGSVVPRLGAALWSMTVPVVLVLDDVHLLHNLECRDALSVLADHVPPGSRLVLAGRGEPPLRIARLRAEGRVLEIGPGAGTARLGRDPGRSGPVQPAAGAAGPARPLVPLPSPVPGHAPGGTGPDRAHPRAPRADRHSRGQDADAGNR